jgi:hypothetical protein
MNDSYPILCCVPTSHNPFFQATNLSLKNELSADAAQSELLELCECAGAGERRAVPKAVPAGGRPRPALSSLDRIQRRNLHNQMDALTRLRFMSMPPIRNNEAPRE